MLMLHKNTLTRAPWEIAVNSGKAEPVGAYIQSLDLNVSVTFFKW